MSEIVQCYRFVTKDLRSQNGDMQWVVGEWKKVEGKLSLCNVGLHACRTPYQSLAHVFGDRWFVAEARGVVVEEGDKFCASEMRLVKEIPVSVIHQYTVDCAYHVLPIYEKEYPDDKRPRLALEAKQAWINDPSDENKRKLDAAWAARAAAWAARAAAWDAEIEWQKQHLEELIKEATNVE